ncbi:MAG: chorismate synthase [Candidatus Omnitrophota bacterium]
MLRYMTAGESHGKGIMVILDGVPAGLKMDEGAIRSIHSDLRRRMHGYGRGGRMSIENDKAEIISGIRKGVTIGSPVGMIILNNDYKIDELPDVKDLRPGHADLAGIQKYGFNDARDVLERASARETALRVAAGAVARLILKEFSIRILSHVTMIGGVEADTSQLSFDEILELSDISVSKVRCADKNAEKLMVGAIDLAREQGNTLGGSFEVLAVGVPPGLGSYTQWDRRIDGALARALMSIPAVKAVETGNGIKNAYKKGSEVHDRIVFDGKSFSRLSNNAGGVEGGVTNGQTLVLRAFMKPIATLASPLKSVNIDTGKESYASCERSDVSAVGACGVVAEAVTAIEIASAFLEKFGGDSMEDAGRNYAGYLGRLIKI